MEPYERQAKEERDAAAAAWRRISLQGLGLGSLETETSGCRGRVSGGFLGLGLGLGIRYRRVERVSVWGMRRKSSPPLQLVRPS